MARRRHRVRTGLRTTLARGGAAVMQLLSPGMTAAPPDRTDGEPLARVC